MNAHDTTAFGISSALLGRSRQTVHVVRSEFRAPHPTRHTVLVVPAGAMYGEYFDCCDYSLAALREGWNPYELELDVVEDAEDAS